jgi:hypothetical protein
MYFFPITHLNITVSNGSIAYHFRDVLQGSFALLDEIFRGSLNWDPLFVFPILLRIIWKNLN